MLSRESSATLMSAVSAFLYMEARFQDEHQYEGGGDYYVRLLVVSVFNYYRQAPRNLELARQTLESWIQKYPADFVPRGFLSAFTSAGTGHYETGVEEGLKALELDPDYSIGYENVAWDYIYLNRWSEAEALLRKASEHKVETADYSVIRYFIDFLRKDQAAMEREVVPTAREAASSGVV